VSPVASGSRGISTTLPRQARGSSKKKAVNPDAMDLGEATRVLRVSPIFSLAIARRPRFPSRARLNHANSIGPRNRQPLFRLLSHPHNTPLQIIPPSPWSSLSTSRRTSRSRSNPRIRRIQLPFFRCRISRRRTHYRWGRAICPSLERGDCTYESTGYAVDAACGLEAVGAVLGSKGTDAVS
jgi:hypothetical protein